MEINERILEIMDFYKLSASEFSEKIKVQRSSISHLTSGRNKPSVDFMQKLADSFPEINLNWFVSGIGEMIPKKVVEKTPTTKKVKKESISSPILPFPDFENEIFTPKEQENSKYQEIKGLKNDQNSIQNTDNQINKPKKTPIISDSKNNKEKYVTKIILVYNDNSFEFLENN